MLCVTQDDIHPFGQTHRKITKNPSQFQTLEAIILLENMIVTRHFFLIHKENGYELSGKWNSSYYMVPNVDFTYILAGLNFFFFCTHWTSLLSAESRIWKMPHFFPMV
jgi:hypothetical protein